MSDGAAGTHPLVAPLPARIQFLSEVPQIVVVVEVTERHQVLKEEDSLGSVEAPGPRFTLKLLNDKMI